MHSPAVWEGLKGLEMPKELMALVGEMDMPRFAAESPY